MMLKNTNILNDMEDPEATTRRKDLDTFQGKHAGSTFWLNIDNEWLRIKFSILEPDFY